MKKLKQCLLIITCCALLFSLIGCNNTQNQPTGNDDFLNANSQNTTPNQNNMQNPTETPTQPTEPTTPENDNPNATTPTSPTVNWDDLVWNDDVLNPGNNQGSSGNPGSGNDNPGSNPGTPNDGSDASNIGQLRNALNHFGKTNKNVVVLYSQAYDGMVTIIHIVNNGDVATKKEYTFYEDANAYATAKVGLTQDQYNNELQIILVGMFEIQAVTDPDSYPAVLFSGYTVWR